MPNKLEEITARAKAFSEARGKLAEYVAALNSAIEALKKDNLPRIRRQLTRAAELQSELKALVEDAPEHFKKPKTVVVHGIKCGFEKGRGTMDWADPDQVVALIEKKLPELADVLIQTTKKPLKTPLSQLTAQQLKAIGVTVETTGDQVVVRAVDSEVEKMVTALLKSAQVEETS